jgi:L-threonylcarbamoyladenylate synthase
MIQPFNNKSLTQALSLLSEGQVVAIPTETVYGLAADATNDKAIAQIFAIKNRPAFNPLIIHVPTVKDARNWVHFTPVAETLAAAFWPGSLTLVLRRKSDSPLSLLLSAGLDTVATRCPDHSLTCELLARFGKPLAAPSANLSMEISPTCAQDVLSSLGEAVPLILDGGSCTVGVESTILDLSTDTPTLLRPGGIPVEAIEALIGPVERITSHTPIRAPGMMKRHYAPSIPLRLNATEKQQGEAFLGFGPGTFTENLSPTGDLQEAAANLFRLLRLLDNPSYTGIAVAPIPSHGLGLAINDRLTRASTKEITP